MPAELFQNTTLPEWMSPAKFSLDSERAAEGIGRTFSSAFQAASRQAEEKRQFNLQMPLKVKEAETMMKYRETETAANILRQQDTQNALDDAIAFKAAQSQWNSGDTSAAPEFKTPQASTAWLAWKNNTEIGAIKMADRTAFVDGLKAVSPEGRAAVMGLPTNEDGSPSHQQWMELGNWKKVREAELMEQKKTLIQTTEEERRKTAIAKGSIGGKSSVAFALDNARKLREEATAAEDEVEAARLVEHATLLEQWADKQGKFAPPREAPGYTETTVEVPDDNGGKTRTTTKEPLSKPSASAQPTSQKQSVGGYKAGTIYGGLRYLGGDPKEEGNWEKVK